MNWYLQSGKQSDVVCNTKIEYSRNFRNYKFQTNNKSEIEQIENEIKSKLPSLGYGLKFCKLKDMDNLTKNSLVEKGLINKNMAKDKNVDIHTPLDTTIVRVIASHNDVADDEDEEASDEALSQLFAGFPA